MSPNQWSLVHQIDAVPPPPPITKTDEDFLDLGVEFVHTRDGIKVTELNELFEKVRSTAYSRWFLGIGPASYQIAVPML